MKNVSIMFDWDQLEENSKEPYIKDIDFFIAIQKNSFKETMLPLKDYKLLKTKMDYWLEKGYKVKLVPCTLNGMSKILDEMCSAMNTMSLLTEKTNTEIMDIFRIFPKDFIEDGIKKGRISEDIKRYIKRTVEL